MAWQTMKALPCKAVESLANGGEREREHAYVPLRHGRSGDLYVRLPLSVDAKTPMQSDLQLAKVSMQI
jgi:hypothetical protein